VLVLSVGGGDRARNVSPNLVSAIDLCRQRSTAVIAIVGRSEGAAAQAARVAVIVKPPEPALLTALTESFQSLVLHLVVSHPRLKQRSTTW
jgi:D-sedoheptulose 7-phosphate isomerase